MKRLTTALALVVLVCLFGAASADISPHMSYQGVLKDDAGNAVSDGTYDITFRLYEVASGGTEIWTEMQSVSVEGGIMNVLLGSVASLTTLSWEDPYWLGISVEGEAELDPRTELTTVAYAAHAGFADTAGEDADWVISGDDMYSGVAGGVGIGDTTPEWLFDIHKATADNNYMQMTNAATGDATYSGLLMGVAGSGDAWVIQGGAGQLRLGRGSAYHSINIDVDGKVTVGLVAIPDALMEVAGHFMTQSFEMSPGASSGRVLTSDATGVGTWQMPLAPAAKSAAGNVVLDESGEARVELPESIVAASGALRYQLTCIGGFAPVYVAEKAAGGVFTIAGGEPGMEVSWQVTEE